MRPTRPNDPLLLLLAYVVSVCLLFTVGHGLGYWLGVWSVAWF